MQQTVGRSYRDNLTLWLYPLSVCVFWGIGLLIGLYLSSRVPFESILMMRILEVEHVSIVSVLLVQLFPLFISALLLQHFSYFSILPIVLTEAILFSYSGCILCLGFGDSAWVVRGVTMFAGSLSAPVLLWYWLRTPALRGSRNKNTLCISAAVIALFALIDFFAASVFWGAVL